MSDEFDNTWQNEINDGPAKDVPEENTENNEINETSEKNEIKKEPEHTSVPYTQQQFTYGGANTYWTADGQYRSYNQQNTQSGYNQNNGYSRNNYYQNNGYNTQNNGYNPYQNGYNYSYTYQQPQQQPVQQKKKKSGGKIAAIAAVCAALAIIFSLCAFVVGIMLTRQNVKPADNGTEAVTGQNSETPDTDKTLPPETKPADETTKTQPSTSSDATINTGTSENFLSRTEAAAKTINSVVDLVVEEVVQSAFMQEYTSVAGGSGVILTEDGYIATNNHMVENKSKITVTLRNGQSYDATVVGRDEVTDLAVIKIEATGLSPATFGDSSKLVLAQDVIAIGNALGVLGGTVTEGIVSSLERNIIVETGQEMTVLQTTAVINPGNSGGGLFNMAGECVGIVNAKAVREDTEGVGYAIPSSTAIPVLEDLMKYGYVRNRASLGISLVEILDNYTRRRYGVDELGVYISSIDEGSDAEKAGLQVADRVVSIGGTEITSYDQLKNVMSKYNAGDTVTVIVSRKGTEITVQITFTEYNPQA